jgi:GAF domain-containing protein
MSDEDAVKILLERRGTMYDARIVDVFIGAHTRLMPSETPVHPAAKAVGGARSRGRAQREGATGPGSEPVVAEELLGVSSLARAVAGDANVADVGALSWMMLKSMLPASSMGLFVLDDDSDTVVSCFAAGAHAQVLRGLSAAPGDGVVGWVAAHRRPATNAEPALDFGVATASALEPPLLSSIALPLVHDGQLVAVLSLYATARNAFTDDHQRMLDLLAPRLAASLALVRAAQAAPDRQSAVSPFRLLKGRRRTG